MHRLLPAAVTAMALALSACGPSEAPATRPATPAVGEGLVVRAAWSDDYKPVAATVTTRDMGDARARIGGTLTRLAVRVGDQVRKGQVIAVIADQRITYETSALGAQAAAADAQSIRAQADLARVRALYDKGIYAKARLDQAEAEARAAGGQASAARQQRAASAEAGAQGAVLAPADGRILHAPIPAGSVVMAGQSIATITAGQALLRVDIPEAEALALKSGDTVFVESGDLGGLASSGIVAQVYPAVTAGQVTADITVPGLRADRVGQRVRVRIKVGRRLAILLPSRFVATRFGVDYVRLLAADGQASDVSVQLAPASAPGQVEVLSGLSDGDVVLALGSRP